MNYELALELKDAGFPQVEKDEYISCGCDDVAIKPDTKLVFDCGSERVYKATLSELIEACGERFGTLERINNWNTIQWYAEDRLGTDGTFPCSSPEEAVAKLWLALHKK